MNQAKPPLKAFWTLLQREFWEHKKSWLITSIGVCGLILIAIFFALIYGENNISSWTGSVDTNGISNPIGEAFPAPAVALLVATSTLVTVQFLIANLMQFIYLTGALIKEREGNNISFWRSLPPDDNYVIGAKIVTALLSIPVLMFIITLAITLCTTVISESTWLIFNLLKPQSSGWHFLWSYIAQNTSEADQLCQIALHYIPIIILCSLWALPLVCFLFLIQTIMFNRSQILIAIALVASVIYAERQIGHSNYVETFTVEHLVASRSLSYFEKNLALNLKINVNNQINDNQPSEHGSETEAPSTALVGLTDLITAEAKKSFEKVNSGDGFPWPNSWSFAIGLLLSALFFAFTVYVRKRHAKPYTQA